MASKRKCIQYNVRGTWVNDLKKSRSQFTGQNRKKETKKIDTAAHLSYKTL